MPHMYQVGQMVELRSAPRHSNRPAGPCEVLVCLPHDKGPVLYRVKSLGENNERVVEEGDLTLSEASKAEQSSVKDTFSIAINKR